MAETCTATVDATGFVTTVNFALVWPARTVTEAGIDPMAALPLTTVSAIGVSAAAAIPRLTVPVEEDPPTTEEGEKLTEAGKFGVTVSVPVFVPPLAVAEIWTATDAATAFVATVNVALLWPASTVREAAMEETAAAPETTARVTGVSTAAGPRRVMVPVDGRLPTTEEGEKATPAGVLSETVNVPDFEPPFAAAVI